MTDESAPTPTARIRGIYTTALTHLLTDMGVEVVQASEPIRERFDDDFAVAPADVALETSRDRQGLECSGEPSIVELVVDTLESLALDTFCWESATPRGAVFDGEVTGSAGRKAIVDLGDGLEGALYYDDVDGYVEAGDRYRLQVRDDFAPWADRRPRLVPTLEIRGGLLTLSRDRQGVTAAASGQRATELVGMTDLLSPTIPDGWGLRWRQAALEAELSAMGSALESAIGEATTLEATLDGTDEPGEPARLAAPERTVWCWFGRKSRFELDRKRRAVETTLAGHHRIKVADRAASSAVDFVEAVCGTELSVDSEDFPFDAVATQFGPLEGDRLALGHGKPDGQLITLGTGEVTEWDEEGTVTLEREMGGGGTYDALGVPIESGDVAETKLREGRWWYATTYRDSEGTAKGTYVNICTPVELFPDCARYVDLYIDVIRHADGTVETVDADELEAALEDGLVSPALAEKARRVADALERAFSA